MCTLFFLKQSDLNKNENKCIFFFLNFYGSRMIYYFFKRVE